MQVVRYLMLVALSTALSNAQYPIERPGDVALVERAMDATEKSEPLNCSVQTSTPVLNFAFRFEVRFVVDCPLAQFEGRETNIASYVRIKPSGGPRVILGERFKLPVIPPQRQDGFRWARFRPQAEWSGVFAAGEGEYPVDLVVVDEHRIFRKSWKAKVAPHGKERLAKIAMAPNTVAAASVLFWPDNSEVEKNKSSRVTLLLDAAPIMPQSPGLRAWDRAFLMNSVVSVLRVSQADSIRLVAFNLDQQREIFREDAFNRRSFRKLFGSLQNLELGTVSYRTLERNTGWADLLTKLIREESQVDAAPHAVIFLGPSNRILEKVPREALGPCGGPNAQIFYFKFSAFPGHELPDAIQHLTNACHGTVYTLHNAGDFATAISNMQRKLQHDSSAKAGSPVVVAQGGDVDAKTPQD